MAEALAVIGLIGTITQLLEEGAKIVKRLDDFASASTEAPEFFSSIRVRLVLLSEALNHLSGQAAGGHINDSSSQALNDVVKSSLSRVQTLAALLEKAAPSGIYSPFEKRIQALKSLGYDRKVQRIINQLQVDIQLLTFSQVTGLGNRLASDLSTRLKSSIKIEDKKGSANAAPGSSRSPSSPIEDYSFYVVEDGNILNNTSFNAATYDDFARVLQQQIKTVLPHAIQDEISQIEPKYRTWFTEQLSTVTATIESVVRESGKYHADQAHSQGYEDTSRNEFIDLNCPPEEPMDIHQRFRSHDSEFGSAGENMRRTGGDEKSDEPFLETLSLPMSIERKVVWRRRGRWSFEWKFGSLEIDITRSMEGTDFHRRPCFTVQVTFCPAPALLNRGIKLSYVQKTDHRGYPTISPSLETFAIIPEDSAIFKYAASGDVQGLRSLFLRGDASPSDRTRDGRTPLNFAVRNGQDMVSRYLITEGVGTVDHPSSILYDIHRFCFHLLDHGTPIEKATGFERYVAICRLLESIGCNVSETSFLEFRFWPHGETFMSASRPKPLDAEERAFSHKWFSFLKDINLNIEGEDEGEAEQTCSWLAAAAWGKDPAMIQLLLLSGANVHALAWGNYPMLQMVFSLSCVENRSDEDLVIALTLLLRAGCDPHSRDLAGNSANLWAYIYGKTEVWVTALRCADVDMVQFLAIESERYGTSTAIEETKLQLDEVSRRHGHCFHDH